MPKSVDGDIRLSVNFDNDGIKKGVRTTESAVSGIKSSFSKLGKTVAAAFSVAAIVNFSRQAIELASDIQEVQNVVDTAFGDMSYKCEEFADTAIEQFGMSELSAKQTASTYMAMAKSMGLSMSTASDVAIETAKLTGDVASFYNLDQETAATKLKGIFTGETEALKDLGVVMTETNLQEYALAKGITKKYSAMTQSEKVMLRYEYVTNALSDASGDFVRTQDSWANQTRILSEQWKVFMSEIGSALVTILTPLLQILNAIIAAMTTVAQKFNALVTAFAGGSAAQTAQVESITASVENQNALTDAVNETTDAQKKSLAGFDEINKISSDSTDSTGGTESISGIIAGAGESTNIEKSSEWASNLAERIKYALSSLADWFNTTWMPTLSSAFDNIKPSLPGVVSAFQGIFSDIKSLIAPLKNLFNNNIIPFLQLSLLNCSTVISNWISTLSTVLSGIWSTAIYPVFQTLLNTAYPFLVSLLGKMGDIVTQILSTVYLLVQKIFVGGIMPAFTLLSNVFKDVWASMKSSYDEWAAPIFAQLSTAIANIETMLTNVWEGLVMPIWSSILTALTEIWDNNLKPLWDNILDFVGELVDCALVIYNSVIAPIIQWLQKYVYPIVVKVVQEIADRVKIVVQGIIDIVGGLITYWKGIVQFIKGVFTGDWKSAWEGVKTAFKGIWDSLTNIIKTPINLIIKMINKMLDGVIGGINKIIGAINTLSFDVPDWIPGIGGETFGFNLELLKVPQIPMLAQGAVIPANKPFLSILGDQRRGTNIEAPLSTIQEAVAAVMQGQQEELVSLLASSIGVQNSILEAILGIQIGDDVIGKAALRYNNKRKIMYGG